MSNRSHITDHILPITDYILPPAGREAAGTKWNFHPYKPGLVGGHCIPVDPYYLVYKAKELGYHPQVILAGRAINDYKLFCKQKPLLNCLRYFCFAKRNISLVKLSFLKKGLLM